MKAFRMMFLGGAALLTSCHEGSSGGATAARSVRIEYPPPVSWTDVEAIVVRGAASTPTGVTSIEVNGQAATTTDGFATWEATVPLAPGANILTVALEDGNGTVDPMAARVEVRSDHLMPYPNGLADHSVAGFVVVLDGLTNTVLALDTATGSRVRISDSSSAGPELRLGRGIARDGNRVLVIDAAGDSLMAVDLTTGDRSIVSNATIGAGPELDSPSSIGLDGDRAIVTSVAGLLAVDLSTGDRTLVSPRTAGASSSVVVEGNRAIVYGAGTDSMVVLGIDLATGDETILSGDGIGAGPDLEFPFAMALDGSRVLVLDRDLLAVVAVDLVTGDRTVLSAAGIGGGPDFRVPLSILVEGGRALVGGQLGVFSIDLATGDRTLVAPAAAVGDGPRFSGVLLPATLATGQGHAFFLDGDLPRKSLSLVSVDLSSGDRQLVPTPPPGTDAEVYMSWAMRMNGEHLLAVGITNSSYGALFRIDPATGEQTIVSGGEVGGGELFEGLPQDVAVHGDRALVLVIEEPGLYSVDLVTGDRQVLAGSGPMWTRGVSLEVVGDRALVANTGGTRGSAWGIYGVDLTTGERSIVSSAERGDGPSLTTIHAFSVKGNRVYVGANQLREQRFPGYETIYTVDLETGDRAVLSEAVDGKGPGFTFYAFEVAGDRLVMMNSILALMEVDPIHGQRTVISR